MLFLRSVHSVAVITPSKTYISLNVDVLLPKPFPPFESQKKPGPRLTEPDATPVAALFWNTEPLASMIDLSLAIGSDGCWVTLMMLTPIPKKKRPSFE